MLLSIQDPIISLRQKNSLGHPYTLELTMKGWRIASLQCDSMNGDYKQVVVFNFTYVFRQKKECIMTLSCLLLTFYMFHLLDPQVNFFSLYPSAVNSFRARFL